MSFDWDHSYCLNCDKQTDGTTYCSESCRLEEFEQSSSPSSTGPSSPAFNSPVYPWAYSTSTSSNKFHLPASYNISSYSSQYRGTVAPPQRALSPSSSHTSLSSMKSSSSTSSETSQLSQAAKKQLHAYASSFENARSSRRQSH